MQKGDLPRCCEVQSAEGSWVLSCKEMSDFIFADILCSRDCKKCWRSADLGCFLTSFLSADGTSISSVGEKQSKYSGMWVHRNKCKMASGRSRRINRRCSGHFLPLRQPWSEWDSCDDVKGTPDCWGPLSLPAKSPCGWWVHYAKKTSLGRRKKRKIFWQGSQTTLHEKEPLRVW